ncbi:hypothetical protein [Demequina sp. NBRC 110055]|uniref:hypothetical protein n=1 Tax=Demequina sp. NBRC 110055 TaxID=1570344 RepID=UPI001186C053|nr:hypothetical protein [Demequina sp. NBRC 110055]
MAENSADGVAFKSQVNDALQLARGIGASDAQLQVLEDARERGELTLDAAREAARLPVQCLIDAGLDAQYEVDSYDGGMAFPRYAVAAETVDASDGQMPIVDERDRQNLQAVQWRYAVQPSWEAQRDACVQSEQRALCTCLENEDISPDVDADGLELAERAVELMNSTSYQGDDCLLEVDIDAY